eukprot:gene21137-26847_t
MLANGLVFDALLKPRHIPAMLTMLERHPDLACVIDHGAKPDLISGDLATWRDGMSALAAHPRLACKLSGLVTEAGPDWALEALRPVVEHLLTTFGPQRLIFGSDWPVVTLRASYAQWFEAAETLLAGLTETQRAAAFGNNAEKLYLSSRG